MIKITRNSKPFHFPWRDGNRFDILIDGPAYFPRILKEIECAEHFILLEMYLVESCTTTQHFIKALTKAAARGVNIYILLDDFGAMDLKQHERDQLIKQNIHLVFFNKLPSYNTLYNMFLILLLHKNRGLFRNHRKLLLVDGITAFTGGFGLTDEFNQHQHPDKTWRETAVKIQGPVIADWQQLFCESWENSTQQTLSLPLAKNNEFSKNLPGTQAGRVTVNDINRYSELIISLNNQIYQAKQRVWFSTAYFVPGWRIRRRLKRAARAGVDVRLLLPGPITDHIAVRHAGHRFYGKLLKNGVRIFEYQHRFIHSKCVLCDDWVTTGSSNFDRWNIRWNLEANQEVQDEAFTRQIKDMFEQDFANCIEVTLEQWKQRSWHLRLRQWFWKQIERLSQKIGR